ncbi:hypothetical protein DERF_005584 [Dermatophagoides farinae]|uniref:Uncharacterized protein n=1 Tax=Dermatophagoides farinae TaxID=6954 RepID=A0A922L7A7_DERFA|nr:hypothetical protein DERF_005584 [Dermatophagoides farinae]
MFETIKSCLLTIINNDDKNFDIYRIYFKHLYAITNDHDQRYRRRYQMMIILMIILDLRFIYLMANSNKDIDWHLIHLNIVIVEHVDQTVNIWLATFFAMIIYFIKILYFHVYLFVYEIKSLYYLIFRFNCFTSIDGFLSILFQCFLFIYMIMVVIKNIDTCLLVGTFQVPK